MKLKLKLDGEVRCLQRVASQTKPGHGLKHIKTGGHAFFHFISFHSTKDKQESDTLADM